MSMPFQDRSVRLKFQGSSDPTGRHIREKGEEGRGQSDSRSLARDKPEQKGHVLDEGLGLKFQDP